MKIKCNICNKRRIPAKGRSFVMFLSFGKLTIDYTEPICDKCIKKLYDYICKFF
jgi:hypothetical protein